MKSKRILLNSLICLLIVQVGIAQSSSDYLMSSQTITTDNGKFYDSGGSAGNYVSDENDTITFIPESTGKFLLFSFNTFDVEGNSSCSWDYLMVFDSTAADSAALTGTYCNNHPLTETFASNTQGALTFVFVSDGTSEYAGWEADISTITELPVYYRMKDTTITTDHGYFTDIGGKSGDYTNDLRDTLTFYPESSGQKLQFVFTEFITEGGYDTLVVFDGTDDTAPKIGVFDEDNPPDTITATNNEGAVTFIFYSDGVLYKSGWVAKIMLADAANAVTADFTGSPVTGTAPLTVNFTDQSTNATSWIWDLDNDGTIDATFNQSPSFTYENAGTYSVKLEVTDGEGNGDTEIKTDYITVSDPTTGDSETETNDSYEAADIMNLVGSISGNVGVDNDTEDFFKVTLPHDGKLQVVGQPAGTLNLEVDIVDADGSGFLSTEQIEGDLGENDTIIHDHLQAGYYYIRVHDWSGEGDYTLSNQFTETAFPIGNDTEPNDGPRQALPLSLGDKVTGHISFYRNNSEDSEDWYEVTLPYDGKLTLIGSPDENLDIEVDIVDADSVSHIATERIQGGSGVSDTIIHDHLKAGNYFIRVNDWNGFGSYELTALFAETDYPAGNDAEPNDEPVNALALALGETVTGHVSFIRDNVEDPEDWYEVTLPYDGKLTLIGSPDENLDIEVDIVDADSVSHIATERIQGGSGVSDTIIHDHLKAGNYFIRVNDWSGFGSYALTALFAETAYPTGNDAEPNDEPLEANPLELNTSVTGHLSFIRDNVEDPEDWYEVTLPYDGRLEVTGLPDENLNLDIDIADADSVSHISTKKIQDGYGVSDTIIHDHLKAGNYFIRVNDWSGFGSYALKAEFTATSIPEGDDAEPNNTVDEALALDMSNVSEGHVGYFRNGNEDNVDWYTFTLDNQSDFTLFGSPDQTLDMEIKLFQGNGINIVSNCSYCGDYNETDTIKVNDLPAGDYAIRVSDDYGYGSYRLSAIAAGQATPLVPDFTADVTAGNPPLEVQFNDRSTGDILSWKWDFGNDGTIDNTSQNPSYTYDTEGTYTVSLSVYDGSTTLTETKTGYITVSASGTFLSAGFSADETNGNAPLTVNFTDESTKATSWEWDFGDGSGSSEQSPSHTYDAAGTYSVTQIVSDGSTTDTLRKLDHITVSSDGMISSTESGGKWNETTTWVGGVIPGAGDDVVIDGNVLVEPDVICRNITINEGAILENYQYFDRELQVTGSITNNGIIRANPDSYRDFNVQVAGNITNNGEWLSTLTICNGNTDQILSMGPGASFSKGRLEDADSSSMLVAGSDLHFSKGFRIDLRDAGDRNGQLVLPPESGFKLYLDSVSTEYTWIDANQNEVHLTNQAYFDSYTHVKDAALYGTINISGSRNVYFEGDSTLLTDTLQNFGSNHETLIVNSKLVNHGVIRDFNVAFKLSMMVKGDVVHDGIWNTGYTKFNGTSEQIISLRNGSTIDCTNDVFGEVKFMAMQGSSNFQWHKDGDALSGRTEDYLAFFSLTPEDAGSYYCSTNDGNSRNIVVKGKLRPAGITADFTANVTAGEAPLSVQFTDESSGDITSWEWDFDNDGNVDATEQNPSYTYPESGTYSVSLMVGDGTLSDDTIMTDYISVSAQPVAAVYEWILQEAEVDIQPEGISFVSEQVGFVTGWSGKIYKTTDGAGSWTDISRSSTVLNNDVYFINENTGFTVNYQGEIHKTSDAGGDWSYEKDAPAELNALCFLNSSKGLAVGNNGNIYYTSNTGDNWYARSSGSTEDLLDVTCLDTNTAIAVGKEGLILKSTDGGATWASIASGTTNWIYAVDFPSATTGYAAASSGVLLKSEDGGNTWSDLNSGIEKTFSDISFAGENKGVAVTVTGHVIMTEDGGATWEETSPDRSVKYNVVSMASTELGYTLTRDGKVYKYQKVPAQAAFTADVTAGQAPLTVEFTDQSFGAESWHWDFGDGNSSTEQNPSHTYSEVGVYTVSLVVTNGAYTDTLRIENYVAATDMLENGWNVIASGVSNELKAVTFASPDTGYVAGGGGLILRTTNAGMSWNTKATPATEELRDIDFADNQNGWAVGGGGRILLTRDAGETWEKEYGSNMTAGIYGVDALSPDLAYACGYAGLIMTRQTDGSWSWKQVGESVFRTIGFADENTGWVAGNGGKIYKTTDGGENWSVQTSGTTSPIYQLQVFDASKAVALVSSGNVIKTTDGGENWSEIGGTNQFLPGGMFYPDEMHGWIIRSGNSYYTRDGGQTWEEEPTGNEEELDDVCFTDTATGYAVGDNGTILKFTGQAGMVSVDHSFAKHNLRVYPNPTSGMIHIAFDGREIRKIEIYNMQGQLVQTSFRKQAPLSMDLGDQKEGLYLMKITGEQKSWMRKIILR